MGVLFEVIRVLVGKVLSESVILFVAEFCQLHWFIVTEDDVVRLDLAAVVHSGSMSDESDLG